MKDAIISRRSIRKYTDQALPEGTIEAVLKAAVAAPSAGNEQPWHFLVITDREKLAKMPEVHEYSSMVPSAQACIMVCGEPALAKNGEMWVQDCAAATENILLALNAMGLGGVWLGCYPKMTRVDGIAKMFGVPEGIVPFSLVPLGYPAEEKPPRDNYKAERVHWNEW
jgi:nitroreductase